MELNEAIIELEEHGYLLNEWKATPDFDELSPEDKVTLTKAMNGAYTARKSGNAKNLAKYSAVLNDIASKMKNPSAIKKIQKMVGKMGPSDGATSAPARASTPAPKKSPKTVKLVTVKSYHFTGYKYETDWFSDLMSRSYKAAERIVDRLKSEYNGSSVRNEIKSIWRDDHDGEEGYYEMAAIVPENNVQEVMDAFKKADDLAKVEVAQTREVANNKEKAKTLPEIWYERYKHKSVSFKILELRCFGQKYKGGKPTEYIIINKSGIKNSKIATIYKGSDKTTYLAENGLYKAIYNNKFTNHTRQDAAREDTPYVYVSWLTKEGLAELIKSAKVHPEAIKLQTESGTPITDIPQRYIYAFLKEYLKEG